MQWNSSNVFGTLSGAATSSVNTWHSGTANASLPSSYDWNVTVNLAGTGWSIGTATLGPLVSLGNILLCIQGTFGSRTGVTDPVNITAISLKPGSIGSVLWTKSYPQAPSNITRTITAWDPNTGVFMFEDKETLVHWGYSLSNGAYLWGPTSFTNDFSNNWLFFMSSDTVAYGNLYSAGYSGIVYCYDDLTGALEWTYGNGGEGNSTNAGYITPYGMYPQQFVAIADGMIYIVTNEHSPNSPMYKGAMLRCINATTGAEIWTIFG
jgi:outer membrane protein assembly factor BamB